MAYTQEQIIQALTVIKETCKENTDCAMCPFSNREKCLVSSAGAPPEEWNLNKTGSWRAIIL